jgi:Na+/H+-translocating membrane pyrophosphatase
VTELALILGIQGAALAYALVVGRSVVVREGVSQRLRRLEGALERATSGFFGQQARVVLFGALGAAALLLGLHSLYGDPGSRLGVVRAGLIGAASVGLGAALTLGSAYAILRLNLRASFQIALAASSGLDRTLRIAVRTGGVASLVCEGASALGLILAFGTVFALAGGTAIPAPEALALAREVSTWLTGFPLGAAIAALVLARASGTYHTASTLGADLASAREAAFAYEDPRNPALVGGVAGDHLAEGASRAGLLFLMASASHVAVLALGLGALEGPAQPPLALLFLPFLARAFFLLASMFAFMVVRTEELANPSTAIARGHLSATVIGLSGLLGCSVWLVREQFAYFFAAGVIASLTAVLVAVPVWARLLRRTSSLREAGDALRAGGGSAALASFTAGLESTLFPTFALGLGAALVWHVGVQSGLPAGGLFASLVGWGSLFGAAPFAFAVSSVATLGSAARGAAALGALDSQTLRHTDRLDETHIAAASARAQLIAAGAGTALLSALAIPVIGRAPFGLNLGLLDPAVTWSGALGVALVLAYTGSSTRAGVRGAREVAFEVERQLRGFPREQGMLKIPSDFSPSYKSCVDLSARSGLRRLWPYAFGVLLLEGLTAFGLYITYRSNAEPVALRGLTSFVLFSAITGFAAASAIDTARATLAFVRRLAKTQFLADPRPLSASAGVSDLLGSSAGPAAQAVLIAAAATGLALAPFLKN